MSLLLQARLWAQKLITRPFESLGHVGSRLAFIFSPQSMSDLKLFDFQSLRDIGKFEIATDRAIGGNTVCSFGVKHTPTGVFGVFEGVLSNDDPLFRSRDRRTAVYATFRTKPHEALPDLGPFSALQFRVKTDGRPYLVMLTSRSADFEAQLDEWRALDGLDTWQCELAVPAGRWVTVTAPFDEFLRVDKGHVTILQHPLTDEERRFRGPDPSHLLSMAVVLADGVKGDFRFCIKSVTAARFYNPDDHSLKLPASGRLKKRRGRLADSSDETIARNERLEAPRKAFPPRIPGNDGGDRR